MCDADERYRLLLAASLTDEPGGEEGFYDQGEGSQGRAPSRADQFEYVMYGKVYRIEGDDHETSNMHALFPSSFLSLSIILAILNTTGDAFLYVLCFAIALDSK